MISIQCREVVMGTRGDGIVRKDQVALMEKVFHGEAESYASVADALLQGKGYFSDFYDKTEIEVNRPNNDLRLDGSMYSLKPEFHLNPEARHAVNDVGFTRTDIVSKRATVNAPAELLSGRNITDRGLTVCANFRLALKFFNEFAPNGNLPSGKSIEDMLLYIRQKMYVLLKGCKKMAPASREFANTEDDMQSNYLFTGFMAFAFVGPLGHSGTTLNCLSVNGAGAAKVSRKAIRAGEADRKAADRLHNIGGTAKDPRGCSIRDKFNSAHLSVQVCRDKKREARDNLMACHAGEANCLRKLECISKICESVPSVAMLERQANVLLELDSISTRKLELEEAVDLMTKDNMALNQMSCCQDQVGFVAEPVEKRARVDGDAEADADIENMEEETATAERAERARQLEVDQQALETDSE